MRYVCGVCGYIYDDKEQKVPFEQLPDSWTCPLCGAAKSQFSPVKEETSKKTVNPKKPAVKEEMTKLSYGQLAVVCSNLARGCEKQYKQKESELYKTLSDYFMSIASGEENQSFEILVDLLAKDKIENLPAIRSASEANHDRGALRACTWNEKVNMILISLLERYQKEGESFLKNANIWVCTVCGFVYIGENAPELCPVCKVPAWKFEKIGGK